MSPELVPDYALVDVCSGWLLLLLEEAYLIGAEFDSDRKMDPVVIQHQKQRLSPAKVFATCLCIVQMHLVKLPCSGIQDHSITQRRNPKSKLTRETVNVQLDFRN